MVDTLNIGGKLQLSLPVYPSGKKMAAISGRLQPTTKSGTVLICDYIFVVLD